MSQIQSLSRKPKPNPIRMPILKTGFLIKIKIYFKVLAQRSLKYIDAHKC